MACDFAVVTRADVEGLELLEGEQEVYEALHGPFPRHDVLDVDIQGMLARAQAASLVKVMGALERLGARRRAPEGATEAPGGGRAAEGDQGAARGVANSSNFSNGSPARLDGPTRWRVLQSERWVGTHTDRAAAFAQAKTWRQTYGTAMRVVRVTTVQRRWRVGGELCFVYRAGGTWLWSVGRGRELRAGCTATFAAAVEAAERAAKAGVSR